MGIGRQHNRGFTSMIQFILHVLLFVVEGNIVGAFTSGCHNPDEGAVTKTGGTR
jgi:hypothetical protein